MEYRIEKLESFKIVGFKKCTTNANMEGMRDCPDFWKQIIAEGKNENLAKLITSPPYGLIGANVYNIDEKDAKKFDYYIGAATNLPTPKGLEEYIVPAMTWAVFPCTRTTSGETEINIVMKWAPSADYELLNTGYETGDMISAAPDLEVYKMGEDVEIWVPVKTK